MQNNSYKYLPNLFIDKKKICHVLQENNENVDLLANKESSLESGVLIYANGEIATSHSMIFSPKGMIIPWYMTRDLGFPSLIQVDNLVEL